MKALHLEPVGGASGDMVLGALISLGADVEQLRKAISSLPIEHVDIAVEETHDRHIHGIRVSVHAPEAGHHGNHDHHHVHRGIEEIGGIVGASSLPQSVKEQSMKVFQRIAEAEGRIHGVDPREIHFHEVGALDSITDIVCSCLALHMLKVEAVSVAAFPLGHGTIECMHGTYPSPAPATLELLKGFPVVHVDEPFETVTPTGAALLTVWRTLEKTPAGEMLSVGYGIGHRGLEHRPNLLRATLIETSEDRETEECLVIECNVDDTIPELLGSLSQKLLQAGALDVFTTAAQMKKQRPGVLLTVLASFDARDRLLDLIFSESTTFGVREHTVRRTMLERRSTQAQTPFGPVRIKIGRWKGADVTWAPEMEDCIARAAEKGVSVRSVYETAAAAAQELRQQQGQKAS